MKKLLIISTIAFLSCNSNTKETAAPAEKISVSNNGVHIDYTDTQKGDTVLLFVHGWAINKTYWDAQVDFFKDKYRVVAIDLPGYGMSGKNRNDWSVAAFGADVDSVMAQLNLKNVVLIGHSMSGDIVLDAAVHAPERVIGIAGVDNFKSVGAVEDSASLASYKEAIAAMGKDFKGTARPYIQQYLFGPKTDSAAKKRIMDDMLSADTTVAVATMAADSYKEVPALVKLNKKLYIIGSDVTPVDTKGLVENKIQFRIGLITGSGHYPMIEQPGAFNLALESVLREIGDKNE